MSMTNKHHETLTYSSTVYPQIWSLLTVLSLQLPDTQFDHRFAMDTATALQYFEGIPKASAISSPPPLPSAVLVIPGNDGASNSTIEIGKSSQVVPKRNALVVGRQVASCDIRMAHKSLSRQHALLYYYSSKLYAFDMNTKAGTFVNQSKIIPGTPLELKDGDTIQFGKAKPVLSVRWGDAKNEDSTTNDGDKVSEDATNGGPETDARDGETKGEENEAGNASDGAVTTGESEREGEDPSLLHQILPEPTKCNEAI